MPLPDHLFVSETSGGLYDTRDPDWSKKPALRPNYKRHHPMIRSIADLKAALRAGEFAWPGGYQLYFVTRDGGTLSYDAARAEFKTIIASWDDFSAIEWRVIGCHINFEDENLVCDHTGKPIACAYPAN